MPDTALPVLIAGGGTVGLAAALFLAHHGIPTPVAEREEKPSAQPGAADLGPRAMEMLREVGLEDAVSAAAGPEPALECSDQVFPSQARGPLPQSRLDALLLDAAREHGAAVRYGIELVSFTSDGDGITATLAGRHGPEVMRTPYLVAADGTRSPARAALGIGTSGPGLLADRFAAGRVFLAGDAAHTVPPPGAFGLDAGIADAHNLAWKLAAVIGGQACPALLGTYEAERRPAAEMTLAQALLRADEPGLGCGQDPGTAAGRTAGGAMSAPVVHLGYRYDSAAVIDPQPALPSAEDITLDLDGSPGTRLPHAWLVSDGPRRSTLDLVQSRFTVLAGPDGEPWVRAAQAAAARLGVPLGAYRIVPGAAGAADVAGTGGEAVGDASGRWAEQAGLGRDGALLVRPDQFVAWRSPSLPGDPAAALTDAVTRILAREGGGA